MAKPFIDVSTGKEYDTLPEGTVRLGKLDDGTYIIKYNGEFIRVSPNDPRIPKMYSENSTREQLLSKYETREGTQKAIDELVRRTAFSDEDTLPFLLESLSPVHLVRAVYDGVKQGSYQAYVNSLKYHNPGLFTHELYEKYPWLEAFNVGADVGLTLGTSGLYRYATTPKMMQGASKLAWTTPLSRRVTYIGGDPAYMAELSSSLPKTLQYTYEGITKDGQAVHSAPKIIMKKNPSKSFVLDMHRRGIFRMRMPGDTEKIWFNRRTGNVATDVEHGWNLQLGEVFVDPEVMSLPEYATMMGYRSGGRLIAKYKNCNI